jgi:hypothetical protein
MRARLEGKESGSPHLIAFQWPRRRQSSDCASWDREVGLRGRSIGCLTRGQEASCGIWFPDSEA